MLETILSAYRFLILLEEKPSKDKAYYYPNSVRDDKKKGDACRSAKTLIYNHPLQITVVECDGGGTEI